MKKLFLIDAYACIYRAYYAFIKNPRINSKGLNTSAIFGFVNTLEDVLKHENPSHIAVAFDPQGKTFRHEAFEQYKAQREATPEDIRKSIPIIKEIIAAYNIPILQIDGYEADDVIGTMAKKAEEKGFDTYMLTPDKDYGQLVSEHIFMYRPKHSGGFETMGIAEVKSKYDLDNQAQVIDMLGLMGDTADNIPGCPGVGEKTAIKLLKEFGNIDNMLANTDKLKGALKEKIETNKEQIIFSRFLATIKTDVPITFDEEKLKVEEKNTDKLTELFTELEFRNFLAKITGETPATAPVKKKKENPQQTSLFDLFDEAENAAENEENDIVETHFESINTIKHLYKLIESESDVNYLCDKLLQQKSVCFDTETTGVNVFESELVGMSFCWTKGEAYFVLLPENRSAAQQILEKFRPFFENNEIAKIGQNMKFDLLMLKMYGIDVKGALFDTMIAHYLIQPELHHGMDYLAEIYLKYKTIHYEELVGGKGKKQLPLRNVEKEKLADYAAEDADITLQLKEILEKEITEKNLDKLFYEMEMPLMRVLATMELNGVRIDSNALKMSSETLTAEMKRIEQEIYGLAGMEFNISSPKQVGEVLFEKLKIDEKAKKTKSGQYSTSEDVLEKLRNKHPIVARILDLRGIKKLLSTYIDALPELVNKKTGKIHTSYNQTITSTGRLSSSNPNLQNIPVRDEQGKEIRKAFIPDEGSTFLSADYSQIELRIMAHLSGDKNMIDAFCSGNDIHAATAAKIYKVPLEEVTKDMRRKAKTANFGIIYGISVFGLSERLNIPRAEAKELIEGYFRTYPDVKAYMDRSISLAKEKGYVETLFGRKRYLADINSQNSVVRGFAERNAINAPIQGTAADIIKLAMIRIQNSIESEHLQAKMILQVHDELNFTVPKNEVETLHRIVVNEMEHVIKLSVPLIADCAEGNNWLEAH
ncbi:MAG: DNA polymerase I [Paludibacteraceae bacterium]|nr:DNA polymerase I [Paludibacteraceae bacterium]